MRNPRVWAVACVVLAALVAVLAWTVPGLNGYQKHGRTVLGATTGLSPHPSQPVESPLWQTIRTWMRGFSRVFGIRAG